MLHKIYNQLGCYLFHNLKLKFDYSLYLCTHIMCLCFPGGSEVKASACNAGNLGSIPGSGRSPGEGNGNPLQYSCLENSMDRGVTQSCPALCDPWWTAAHQAPQSIGFSRQNCRSELPGPPPWDLPDPGIEPRFPALQVDSLQLSHQRSLIKRQ